MKEKQNSASLCGIHWRRNLFKFDAASHIFSEILFSFLWSFFLSNIGEYMTPLPPTVPPLSFMLTKEIQIILRLFLVCHILLQTKSVPSQPASNVGGLVIH